MSKYCEILRLLSNKLKTDKSVDACSVFLTRDSIAYDYLAKPPNQRQRRICQG